MELDLSTVLTSPGLWLVSSLMVIVTVTQAIIYYRLGQKEADRLEIPRTLQKQGIKSAMITAAGPSLAACIVLISMITIVGAPTTWMRLNVIGSSRSELAMTNFACDFLGVEAGGVGFGVMAFTLALWGMALNDAGWILGAMVFTPNMGRALSFMNKRFDPVWVKKLMSGTIFGVFGYLLVNACWKKGEKTPCYLTAAVVAAATYLVINKFFKSQKLKELGLGIAMLVGMFAASGMQYALGL